MESSDANNGTKYRSRILREMEQGRQRPFRSPPSSTGSHGTISPTMSTFTFDHDLESARRLDDTQPRTKSTRFSKPPVVVNRAAAEKLYPEWRRDATTTSTQDVGTIATKENVPPGGTRKARPAPLANTSRSRTLADLQARVENESDCSTVLSQTPAKPLASKAKTTRFARAASQAQAPAQPPRPESPSITELVSTLRTSQAAATAANKQEQSPPKVPTRRRSPLKEALEMMGSSSPAANIHAVSGAPQKFTATPDRIAKAANNNNTATPSNPTGRSFFFADLHHINDLVSGTLKFSKLRSDGVPIFVKHGKVRDRHQSPMTHDEVDALEIPEDEHKIFVSMDNIREEIIALQEHDEMVQKEAQQLQLEVAHLQSELQRMRSRKGSDSAIGSESDGSNRGGLDLEKLSTFKNAHHVSFPSCTNASVELEEKVSSLQKRLEEATSKLAANEVHQASLAAERDHAIRESASARTSLAELRARLETTEQELEAAYKSRRGSDASQKEIASLREDNNALRHEQEVLMTENQSLRSNSRAMMHQLEEIRQEYESAQQEIDNLRAELESLQQEYESAEEQKVSFEQENASLVRNNEKYYEDNKVLRRENSMLERRKFDLEDENARLKQLIDAMQNNQTETGVTDAALQRELEIVKKENEALKAKVATMKKDIEAKSNRIVAQGNELVDLQRKQCELLDKIDEKQAEWIKWAEEGQERERQSKELADQMRKDILRGERAVQEVAQLTEEINRLKGQTITKPVKATRIVEPPKENKGKDVTGEASVKSTASQLEEDPTTQLDLTQGSDYANDITGSEAPYSRSALNQARVDTRRRRPMTGSQMDVDDMSEAEQATGTVTDTDVALRRTKSDDVLAQKPAPAATKEPAVAGPSNSNGQRAGILRNARSVTREEFTENVSVTSMQSQRKETARPKSRLHRRHNSANDADKEDHMLTSAFIIPDITLDANKDTTTDLTVPGLSKDARRVLNSLCKHDCGNCSLCTRIAAYRKPTAAVAEGAGKKKTIHIPKPVPVSERMPDPSEYKEEPTLRPSQPPAQALALVLKELQDELDHLRAEQTRKQALFASHDASLGRRERKQLSAELRDLLTRINLKSDQIYALYDVVEGQKAAGQEMSRDGFDVTVSSIVSMDNDQTGTRTQKSRGTRDATGDDGTWNGIQE